MIRRAHLKFESPASQSDIESYINQGWMLFTSQLPILHHFIDTTPQEHNPMTVRTTRQISCRTIAFIIIALFLLATLWNFNGHFLGTSTHNISQDVIDSKQPLDHPQHRSIAMASAFGFHFDVYMTVAWTIQRLKLPVDITVYTELPFYHEFQAILDNYRLYSGAYKHHSDLIHDVLTKNMGSDNAIDMIILGTCEIDMRNWGEELLSAWDAREADQKFQVVCIVHNIDDKLWQSMIPEWARRNAIRLLPISSHVKETYHQVLLDRARSSDPSLRSAGLEHVPIDVHVPILDVQNLRDLSPTRLLSQAVIQGSFSRERRDYTRIFFELNQSLHEDPLVWGYERLGSSRSFLPHTALVNEPPFQLHLVGSGSLDVPAELENIVVFHTDLNYKDFYEVMGGMDICIPAFLASEDFNYKRQELRNAYKHIDDDRITITRPAVMSEVEALKALRSGDASAFLSSDPSNMGITLGSHRKVRQAVDRMVKGGWVRSKAGFDARKMQVWRENEEVLRRILRDE
ncbi:hypothetical protein CPC08DRAFT_439036 [Agrocybe pediades]|nr:hypothetical protein CPC08DRAFT_439036 [Agrocybe pediades]